MANKKVIIRVDGNNTIGLGHLYRGIALAGILSENFSIELLTKADSIISPISNSGFEFSIIPDEVEIWNEPIWISDNYTIDSIIVLDGYHFTEVYQQSIKNLNFNLVYIDDLTQGKQKADLVINHSPGVKKSDYKKEKYTKLALGLNYALLRKSFIEYDRSNIKSNSEIKNIFISFGGSDIHDFSFTTVTEILNIDYIDTINVVLGAAYKNKAIFDLNSSKLKIHKNVSEHEIFKLMEASDLAIVPASTTSIELASLGIPMILGYFVDNQKRIYNGFLKNKAITGIGDFNNFDFKTLKSKIESLNNSNKLIEQSLSLLSFFEKMSYENIFNMFQFDNILLRIATGSDMKFVFDLSNESLVRSNSYDSNKIELDQHEEWFQNQLKDDKILFYIVEIDNTRMGQVRFSIKEEYSIIGISIINNYRGKGLAKKILNKAVTAYFENKELPIYAYIKKTNLPSIESFKNAGFYRFKEEMINDSVSYIYKKENNENW